MIDKTFSIVFLSEIIGNTAIICFLEYGVLVVQYRGMFNEVITNVMIDRMFLGMGRSQDPRHDDVFYTHDIDASERLHNVHHR